VAAIAATQDAQVAAARLLKNQEHLGNAIVPFYGQDAGNGLTELLKQHILIAVDLVAAAKAGQQEQFQAHDQRWTQNARDIAAFLARANPNWSAHDLADLLNVHLTLTKKEAVALCWLLSLSAMKMACASADILLPPFAGKLRAG
jgi:hypothetical protein